ncbi:hypothetical protein IOK49_04380 [Fervidicoccus fontis]|uniref:Uncharacterized protein n=2 Tax=Fervidicoccus fontis TaxID=683846 RepID=I0A173_FERFK|nr:hypothetical protein [Fervidicoccus fontis]AFH42730.1 hypothetical protein FFONT_0742 [Fervidicoccus fontis Kam940]MBE9391308.1 hypothetical protein [Fervidicoccus fontis]
MKRLLLPPRIKVLEALSTIGDKRITIIDDKNAIVKSSDGTREYKVYLDLEKKIANSNDNGTFYKGYMGYPIVSFLMLKGIVPYKEDVAELLKGIQWKTLNEKYKSYKIVENIIKRSYKQKGRDPRELDQIMDSVMEALKNLELYTETENPQTGN